MSRKYNQPKRTIIGQQLRLRRTAKGWSAQEASEKLGVCLVTYYNYESGRCSPTTNALAEVAAAFDTDAASLLSPYITIKLETDR